MHTPSELIDLLGGTTAVARLFGVQPPSVSEWRQKGIPEDRLVRVAAQIEKDSEGKISRRDLFPNDWQRIWPELITTTSLQATA